MPNIGAGIEAIYNQVATGTVTAGNTADQAFPDVPCSKVIVQADADNTGSVYINGEASGTTTGFRFVAATPPQTFYVDNVSRLGYAYGSAASQKLRYIAFK